LLTDPAMLRMRDDNSRIKKVGAMAHRRCAIAPTNVHHAHCHPACEAQRDPFDNRNRTSVHASPRTAASLR